MDSGSKVPPGQPGDPAAPAPLPFTLKVPGKDDITGADISSTTFRFHGLLRFDGQELLLEWAGTADIDEVSGLDVRSETISLPAESLAVPIERIRTVELHPGWWRPHLEVTGSDLGALATVPSEQRGRVRFWLSRPDRPLAARVADAIRLALLRPGDSGHADPRQP